MSVSVATYLALVILAVSMRLVRTRAVTTQAIWAGICVYMLLPVLWTRLYWILVLVVWSHR